MNRSIAFALVALLTPLARADETAIRAALGEFFTTRDSTRRAALAKAIEADPAFDRSKLSQWLHAAVPFPPREPGPQELPVALDTGDTRSVTVRIPQNYDPTRAYPLLYALHGTGGDGPGFLPFAELLLGQRRDDFVIAAPTGYGQRVIQEDGPPSSEHMAVLTAVRKYAHVDSDRIYITGYSLGGHTTWTVAVLHADQFAAAIPMAGSLLLPDVDKLWDDFLPNLSNTAVLCCWGAKDTKSADGTVESEHGGVAGMNRKLIERARQAGVAAVGQEDPEKGHGGVRPQADLLEQALSKRRAHDPARVSHKFRRVIDAQTYWLEAREWKGKEWTESVFKSTLKPGEDPHDALIREIRYRLGQLEGERAGQTISIKRKNVDDIMVWIGDTPDTGIDWSKPVLIKASGNKAFEGVLKPSVLLCLREAQRTGDFDRLRWAGVRVRNSKGTILSPGD